MFTQTFGFFYKNISLTINDPKKSNKEELGSNIARVHCRLIKGTRYCLMETFIIIALEPKKDKRFKLQLSKLCIILAIKKLKNMVYLVLQSG